MICEEKVKIMTKMAIYESNINEAHVEAEKYYREDYLSYNAIKTWVFATLSYAVVWVLGMYLTAEILWSKVNLFTMFCAVLLTVLTYLLYVLIWHRIARKVSQKVYEDAEKERLQYLECVEELESMYEKDIQC